MGENMNTDEFMKGQRDCLDNLDHLPGQSESYDRGYAAQYEWNAVRDEMSHQQNELIRK